MVKITIDYTKCAGAADKICVEICPISIFRDKKSAKPHRHLNGRYTSSTTCQRNYVNLHGMQL